MQKLKKRFNISHWILKRKFQLDMTNDMKHPEFSLIMLYESMMIVHVVIHVLFMYRIHTQILS